MSKSISISNYNSNVKKKGGSSEDEIDLSVKQRIKKTQFFFCNLLVDS